MKNSTTISIFILTAILFSSTPLRAQNYETDWALFSDALVEAINLDNRGVQLGAIQQIAIYGALLDVDAVVFDIVRVYRNSKDENEQILALSALSKMGNAWAMDFLARSVRFEKSARLRAFTIDVVNQYHMGPTNSEAAKSLSLWKAEQVPPTAAEIRSILAVAP